MKRHIILTLRYTLKSFKKVSMFQQNYPKMHGHSEILN